MTNKRAPTTRLRWAVPVLLCLLVMPAPKEAGAKLYIDIVSSPRKLPIAIQDFSGPHGKDLMEIISGDLEFSGLFQLLRSESFIEGAGDTFNQDNWAGTGVEAVLKGAVTFNEKLMVTVRLYDVFEGKNVLERQYRAAISLMRPLAHTIANDIYREITGQEAAFRTRIAFVTEDGEDHELNLADWDGMRRETLGIRARAILTPHWSRDGRKLLYSAQREKKWAIYMLDFAEMKETRVYFSEGINIAGDFLPRGDSFLLASSRAGTPDIYVLNIRKNRLKRLTADRGIEVSPAASPDGRKVAFVSDHGGSPQIYTIDKFGYNRMRVTYEGGYNTSPVWSPRGDKLAFSGRYNGKNQIFTVRPDGEELRRLTGEGNNEEPSFSPDGRFIAFTSDRDGTKAVYIMRADGEAQRRVSSPGARAFGPRWSPR